MGYNMGDYILVSVIDLPKGKEWRKWIVPSEAFDYDEFGRFIFKNQNGVFAYERSFVSKEAFEQFKNNINKILDKLERKYRKEYGW